MSWNIGPAWLWSTSTGSKESTCLGEHSHVCLCCFLEIVIWIPTVNTIQLLMLCGLTKSLSWTVLPLTVLADIHLPSNRVYTFHMSDYTCFSCPVPSHLCVSGPLSFHTSCVYLVLLPLPFTPLWTWSSCPFPSYLCGPGHLAPSCHTVVDLVLLSLPFTPL